MIRSARLPGSSEPICASMPSARAPPIVAISSAVRAGTARGSLGLQLVQERRLPHRLEHVEVVVAGGAVGAEADGDAGRAHARRPAVPLASFMLLSGLCETPTWRRARIAMSAGVTQTPCAASVRGPQKPIDSRYRAGVALYCSLRRLHFVVRLGEVDEDRRVRRDRPARARPSASPRRACTSQCGATAGTIRSSPANSLMNASARASPSAGVFASATGNWMIVWPSTPRRPASFVDLRDLLLEVIHVGVGRRARLDHLERGEPRAGAHELGRDGLRLGRERCTSAASPSAPGRRRGRETAPSARACAC